MAFGGEIGPLTAGEVPQWVSALTAVMLGAGGEENPDPEYVRAAAQERVTSGGGELGVTAVRDGGRLIAAARVVECRHPLTHRHDLRIEDLATVPGLRSADVITAVSRLLDTVPAGLPVRIELPVRGPAATAAATLGHAGFVPEVLSLRRTTADPPPADGWPVRPATPADTGFVRDCLARAIRNGLAGEPTAVDVDVDEWVRARFADPLHTDATCVITESNGLAVGHAYATAGPDRYHRSRLAVVHDVFVVPEAKGRGAARALTTALAAELSRQGIPVMEGEVIMRGDPQRELRAGLATTGWHEDRMRWLRPG
jgi:GNAT superfamily N-acetyltransferase